MSKVITYFRESIQEMNNVTWPTRKRAIRITIIVFVFMIVSGIALGFVDELLAYGYRALLNI